MLTTLLIFAALGVLAGFLAGLLGIGGGLVVVPSLYYWFSHDPLTAPYAMHLALGSSLAFIVLNSGAAAWMHHRLGGVQWREITWLAPGLAGGALLGAAIADELGTEFLARWFGGFLVVMSAYLFLHRRPSFHAGEKHWLSLIAGAPMGVIASLAGVGGGVMVVPWLMARGFRPAHAVGTSSFSTVIVALLGAAGYVFFAQATPVEGASGYVYWPAVFGIAISAMLFAPLGAKAAHRVNQLWLRRGFALLMLVIGIELLITA